MATNPSADETAIRLGRTIHRLRKQRKMTLVEVAEAADLSHSFLSQLERGLTSPSMKSLDRIAQALGLTQPALIALSQTDYPPKERVSLVRAGEGLPVDNVGGSAQVLVEGERVLYPTLYTGAPDEWGDWYSHPGDELIHVIAGAIIVELADSEDGQGREIHELYPGDTLYYPGELAHRWRGVRGYGAETARLLFVQEVTHPC